MGHGQQEGRCDMVLSDFARELNDRDSLAFFATVEGTRGVAPMLEQLKKSGAKTVWLAPFMLVAGDPAQTDLGGDGGADGAGYQHGQQKLGGRCV